MSNSKSTKFWVGLAVFQVVFGLAIFGATRLYYLDRPQSARTASITFPTGFSPATQNAIASLGDSGASPRTPDAIAQRADEQFQAGNYLEAADLYGRLVDLDPGNVTLLNNLAITLHYVGRSDEAVQRLNTGLGIEPEHQRSWLTLGFIESRIGNIEEARTALTNAVRLGPDNEVGASAARMLAEMGFDAR